VVNGKGGERGKTGCVKAIPLPKRKRVKKKRKTQLCRLQHNSKKTRNRRCYFVRY
jgi:hypothetical protein